MDLRQTGEPFEKKYTQFSADDIQKITSTFHQWQTCQNHDSSDLYDKNDLNQKSKNQINQKNHSSDYVNIPEFCYSATFEEVTAKDFSLVPSKYIEFVNRDENIDFDDKMKALQTEFAELLKSEEQSKKDL